MPEYLSPGVYVEEVEIGVKPIVSTRAGGWYIIIEITPDSGAKAGFAWVEFEIYNGMPPPLNGFSSFILAGTMHINMKRTLTL